MNPATGSSESPGGAVPPAPPGPPAPHTSPSGPRHRVRYALVAGLVVVVAGGATAAFVLNNDDGKPSGNAKALPAATAPITRGDVVDTESVDGELTYSGDREIAGEGKGVVTKTPAEGATVKRGKPLYWVDDKPVTLMYGSLPLYRTLTDGDEGPDVRQLERNLSELGYGDYMTVDEDFTDATAAAVEDWQDDNGLEVTGSVDSSQIVFQPGAVRISDVQTAVGQQIGGKPVLKVTGTTPIVKVDLDADKQDLAHKGGKVSVEMPDGKTVEGRISKVGSVAKHGGTSDDPTTTIDVYVTLDSAKTGGLDEAPVTVDMESARADDVLSVPIEALLALREGGFGVEVVEGRTSRIVPVTLGTFGSGRVQVSGSGLREGMKVGVPAS